MSRNPIRNAIVPITKRDLVTCKRCGCPNLAWVKFKSGKFGLVETACERPLWRGDGPAPEGLWALKFNFHNCEQYLNLKADIERRANECHPKADTPRDILVDASSHLIGLAATSPEGVARFANPADPLAQALQIILDAINRVHAGGAR